MTFRYHIKNELYFRDANDVMLISHLYFFRLRWDFNQCYERIVVFVLTAHKSWVLYTLNGGELEAIDDAAVEACTGYKGHFYKSEK